MNVVYYESRKREVKTKLKSLEGQEDPRNGDEGNCFWFIMNQENESGCKCYERLQSKTKKFTRLSYTELVLELEHRKIETRLITEMFVNVMGECEN